jgi:hypothetical protein
MLLSYRHRTGTSVVLQMDPRFGGTAEPSVIVTYGDGRVSVLDARMLRFGLEEVLTYLDQHLTAEKGWHASIWCRPAADYERVIH